jgi:hypothetical protein
MAKPTSIHKEERAQQSDAGKKSGSVRAYPAKVRHIMLKAAFKRQPKAYQVQPYSNEALDALQLEACKFPTHAELDERDFDALVSLVLAMYRPNKPFRNMVTASRGTLLKVMQALGIQSKRRVSRSR